VVGQTQTRATIFIAEDNPILLQGLDRALSASGYQVATASSGEEVLAMLDGAAIAPDLLLLDVMMPGLDGFGVLRTLQAHPRGRNLPVLMITAATDEALRATAKQEGAADLLIKPFRLGELLERIEAHVRRGGRKVDTESQYPAQGATIVHATRDHPA
jgi:DNA-binding response OmpR family regulator